MKVGDKVIYVTGGNASYLNVVTIKKIWTLSGYDVVDVEEFDGYVGRENLYTFEIIAKMLGRKI